jgi:Ca2+-binding RTX toxin-like protein
MDASNKQETMAEKFARVWEKKNSKVARAGGVSLMALSLAACGSSSTDTAAVTPTPTPTPDPEPEAPVVQSFALAADDDNEALVGTANTDAYSFIQANYAATDLIADPSATDNDTLTITGTEFTNALNLTGEIRNIENIVANIDSLTNVTVDVDGVNNASNITLAQTRDASGATFTINNVYDGSTVSAGAGVNTLDASTDTADHSLTVQGGAATGTITGTVTGEGTVTINAASADVIVASAADGAVEITAAAATDLTADGVGSVTATGAGSTTADSFDMSGQDITVTVTAEDANMTFDGDQEADDDTLTINAGADFVATLEANDAFETVTVNASAATVATLDTTAADAYVGDANTTFAGNEAMFDGKTVTGAAAVQLTTLNSSDLTGVATGTVIDVAASAASKALTVSTGASIKVSSAITTALDIIYSDEANTDDDTGVVNVELAVAALTGDLTLNTTNDTIATLNLAVSTAPGSFTLTAGDTDVVVSGAANLILAAASTAGSINATAMTGDLTAEATSTNISITGGAGDDTLTVDATGATIVVNGGAGNDTVDVGGAVTGTITGGDGTDTLDITGALDISGATITGFEIVDVNANSVTVDEALLNGQTIVVDGSGTRVITVDNIMSTLDLGDLQMAVGTVGFTASFADNLDASLGLGTAVVITGSDNNDTLQGGNGADTISGGEGTDTIRVEATTSADDDFMDGGAGTGDILAIIDATSGSAVAHTFATDANLVNIENITIQTDDGVTLDLTGQTEAFSVTLAAAGTTASTLTYTGSAGVDTVVTGTGANLADNSVIQGAGGIDLITLDDTTSATVEIILTTGGIGAANADVITNFTSASDIIHIDLSDVEAVASITDLINLDGGSIAAGAAGTSVVSGDLNASDDFASGTGDEIAQMDTAFASAAVLTAALEVGGAEAIVVNGPMEAGDAFLLLWDNGVDSYLSAIATSQAVADDGNFAVGSLTETLITTFAGIADSTTLVTADFVIVA